MSMAKSQLHPKLDMNDIAGIKIPDSKMAQDLTQLVRDTESDLLFHHSTRVYLFGALAGERKGLKYDPELLYVGAMFHDIGLTGGYRRSQFRFEVDGCQRGPRLSAQLWYSGGFGRDRLGRNRAAHHTRHPGAQEAGSGARHLGCRDGRARDRL